MPDATERKVLIVCFFVAGCITLGPMEWVSAGLLLVTSGVLALWNLSIGKREDALTKQLSAKSIHEEGEGAEPARSDEAIVPTALLSEEDKSLAASSASP